MEPINAVALLIGVFLLGAAAALEIYVLTKFLRYLGRHFSSS
ncbi:hypothetical protein BH24ACT22_BH24ACT22_10200 [soil metagenome]